MAGLRPNLDGAVENSHHPTFPRDFATLKTGMPVRVPAADLTGLRFNRRTPEL